MDGDNVTFQCSALGGPGNVIVWQKDRTVLNETSTTLTLTSVSSSDGGGYTCTVINLAGLGNASVFLYINISIIEDPISINVSSGENATLSCEADAFPEPTYSWMYSNGSSINLTNVEGINTNRLQFLPAEFGSEGAYICSASSNDLSVLSEAATLSGKYFMIPCVFR